MCVDRSFPASSGRRGGCARGPSHPLFGKQPRRGRPGRTCWEPASGTPLLGPREQLQFTLPRAFRTPGARARLGWGPPPQNTHPHSLGLGHALPRVRAEGAQPTPGGQGSGSRKERGARQPNAAGNEPSGRAGRRGGAPQAGDGDAGKTPSPGPGRRRESPDVSVPPQGARGQCPLRGETSQPPRPPSSEGRPPRA